jgi:hypothetical protein
MARNHLVLTLMEESLTTSIRRAVMGVPEPETAILRGFTEAELRTFRMFVQSWDFPMSELEVEFRGVAS